MGLLYLAYSPLERGLLALDPYLALIGANYGKSAAQVALNWLISVLNVVPIVRVLRHVEENAIKDAYRQGQRVVVTTLGGTWRKTP